MSHHLGLDRTQPAGVAQQVQELRADLWAVEVAFVDRGYFSEQRQLKPQPQRLQGRALSGAKFPEQPADPIIVPVAMSSAVSACFTVTTA